MTLAQREGGWRELEAPAVFCGVGWGAAGWGFESEIQANGRSKESSIRCSPEFMIENSHYTDDAARRQRLEAAPVTGAPFRGD